MLNNISVLINNYIEYLKSDRHASLYTIRNYAHYLSRFQKFLDTDFPTLSSPSDFDQTVITKYQLFLEKLVDDKGKNLDLRTQSYHLIVLRSFIKYLNNIGVRTISSDIIAVPKTKIKEFKFLDDTQIALLLRLAENTRDRSIMELLLSTGLKVSDIVRLDRSNIDFDRKEITLAGRMGQKRAFFLPESACYWIKNYLAQRKDDEESLFTRTAGKKEAKLRLTVRSIQRIVEKYVKKARLPIKATPHSLRHTFAVYLLSSGTSLSALKNLLGHKNISTTQIYTHITNPQLR